MIRMSREIRFPLLNPSEFGDGKSANSWAGGPASNRLVPRLNLRCVVTGMPDPVTGYLCNIKLLDDLMRSTVAENLAELQVPIAGQQHASAESFLLAVSRCCLAAWQLDIPIERLELDLSPFITYGVFAKNMNQLSITEQFEFSAAHRLHCDELSDQENREVFGKCNNPQGHGHNYVVEVTVTNEDVAKTGQVIDLQNFETTVKRLVIDRLDHKHLNRDEAWFEKLNPSVENIAIAIYTWLEGSFGDAKLDCVRVYETPKTWAEYRGE